MSEEKIVFTRADLIANVAASHDMAKIKAEKIVSDIFDIIAASVRNGDKVVFKGFATFEAVPTAPKPARTGRNPKTGEPIQIEAKPAGKRVSIKAKFPAE